MTYFDAAIAAIEGLDHAQVATIAAHLDALRRARRQVWLCGNGGSAANVEHLTAHLQEAGIRATDLMSYKATLTAYSNDFGYDRALMRQLRLLASAGQALVVVSGSGDSPNIIMALAEARRIGMLTIGLLGFGGGIAKGLCDAVLLVPSNEYGPVEDAHAVVTHALQAALRAAAVSATMEAGSSA